MDRCSLRGIPHSRLTRTGIAYQQPITKFHTVPRLSAAVNGRGHKRVPVRIGTGPLSPRPAGAGSGDSGPTHPDVQSATAEAAVRSAAPAAEGKVEAETPPLSAWALGELDGSRSAREAPVAAPQSSPVEDPAAGPSSSPTSSSSSSLAAAASAQEKVAVRMTVPLQPPVLGLTALHVSVADLGDVKPAHVAWLRQGWETAQKVLWAEPLPRVLGFDTEFLGDQLALVQLCCGDRVLLVRVPRLRPNTGNSASYNGGGGGSGGGGESGALGAAGPGGGNGSGGGAPIRCPQDLETLLCDPGLPKAAAEVWQDALMLYAAFGTKLRNGLDLTAACPPTPEERNRGRKKLSLFDIFSRCFPDSTLWKDTSVDYKQWFEEDLAEQQVRYAALDAFVSYATGVKVLAAEAAGSPSSYPPAVDLSLPAEWEVALAAQWVATFQFLRAWNFDRNKHNFFQAAFRESKKRGLTLTLQLSCYETGLRPGCVVGVTLKDGRTLAGRCPLTDDLKAKVGQLKWTGSVAASANSRVGGGLVLSGAGGGGGRRNVRAAEVLGAEVESISIRDGSDGHEEEAFKLMFKQVMSSEGSLRHYPLAARIFGGDGGGDGGDGGNPEGAGPRTGLPPDVCGDLVREVSALYGTGQLNDSQRQAVAAVLTGDSPVQLVQGPPGTGKTSVISHAVALWTRWVAPRLPLLGPERKVEALVCVARSNVAAKNIALALLKRGLGHKEFRLIVPREDKPEWHDAKYRGALESVLVPSEKLSDDQTSDELAGIRVFVTSVSMLANPRFKSAVLYGKVLTRLLVDEASQIYAADLALPLYQYGSTLRSVALFGDDRGGLQPHGSEWDGAQIPSILDHLAPPPSHDQHPHTGGSSHSGGKLRPQPNAFTVGPRLVAAGNRIGVADCGSGSAASSSGGSGVSPSYSSRIMLAVSYGLPPPLCDFISREMYGGLLQSGTRLGVAGPGRPSIRWVDVEGDETRRGGGASSFCNPREVEVVCRLVQRHFMTSSWTVLTGYDLQRCKLEKAIKTKRLTPRATAVRNGDTRDSQSRSSYRVYNIDTFQGREDEVVLVSLVRSGTQLGFMEDDRRVNVMLTRATRQLVIVGSLSLGLAHPSTLIGRMATHCRDRGLVEAPPPPPGPPPRLPPPGPPPRPSPPGPPEIQRR